MAICSSVCAGQVPGAAFGACGIETRGGGINRLVFASCDVDLVDYQDLEAWRPWLETCKIRATGLLVGQKPRGSYERRRLASCLPETVVGGEKLVTFQDYNSDDANFTDVAFWNALQTNPARFQAGWLTCDGLFYGFYPFGLEVDELIEDSRKGKSFKEGTIYLDMVALPAPRRIPGLEAFLLDFANQTCA